MKRATMLAVLAAATGLASGLAGCETTSSSSHDGHGVAHVELTHAIVILTPTAGSDVTGTVVFEQDVDRMTVSADVEGLEPNSTHAWHIHEFGDISGADGKATGGHYNPEGHPHALPIERTRHAGDLGNLTADERGHAHKVLTVENITIAGPTNAIVGRSIIVHAKHDDGGQPTGNAGARIAQGVIGIAKSE